MKCCTESFIDNADHDSDKRVPMATPHAPITATILFDAGYVESALITAYELRTMRAHVDEVVLVLLLRNPADDEVVTGIIAGFCAKMATDAAAPRYTAIHTRGGLPEFNALHFNSSILYKAVVPSIVARDRTLLNIDAGVLLGPAFGAFLDESLARLHDQPDWVLAAHADPIDPASPSRRLPDALAGLPHNLRYPIANLLFFHPRNYVRANWYERFLTACCQHLPHLCYAEQELICLLATDQELVALPRIEDRTLFHLNYDALLDPAEPMPSADHADCVFFKFVGSVKPWKHWVLDPRRKLYLERRARLEAVFPLDGIELVQRLRRECANESWREGFYRAYEHSLLRGG